MFFGAADSEKNFDDDALSGEVSVELDKGNNQITPTP